MASNGSINNFPNEVLIKIVGYLPAREKIKIERVCKRWRSISLESWRDVKIFDFEFIGLKTEEIQLSHLHSIFQKCGEYLTHITLDYLPKKIKPGQMFTVISKYCTKLESLEIDIAIKNEKDFKFLNTNVIKKLISLKLIDLQMSNIDFLEPILRRAINLQEFSISHESEDVTFCLSCLCDSLKSLSIGSWTCGGLLPNEFFKVLLRRFSKLEHLAISKSYLFPNCLETVCNQLKSLEIAEMNSFFDNLSYNALKFPMLRKLDASLNKLNADFLEFISVQCPLLEDLNLGGCLINGDLDAYKNLGKLKNLTSLNVSSTEITEDDLEYIASHCNQLKKIECIDCENITTAGFSRVFMLLPQAVFFFIGNPDVSDFEQEVVKGAMKSVKARTNNLSLKIKLITAKKINEDYFDTSNVKLKISDLDSETLYKSETNRNHWSEKASEEVYAFMQYVTIYKPKQ